MLERSLGGAALVDRAFLLTQIAELDRRRGLLTAPRPTSPRPVARTPTTSRLRSAARGWRWRRATSRWPNGAGPAWCDASRCRSTSLELGEIQLERGRAAAAEQQFSVIRTTSRLFDANGVNTDLETAIFEADHGSPARALRMARAEWSARQSIHVADALAWALHVNGRDAPSPRRWHAGRRGWAPRRPGCGCTAA